MVARPMLGDLELQQVQQIEVDEDQVLVHHQVPELEGDFHQRLGRRAASVALSGVLTGPDVGNGLKKLRERFRTAEAVPFTADIATATSLSQVLIEEMGVRELAGKPQRFEYAFRLREFIPSPPPETTPPPPVPPPPPPRVDTGTLIVEVEVEGEPDFDFSTVTVTVRGTQEDGTVLSRTLTNRTGNRWEEDEFPPGTYTADAVVTDPQPMTGSGAGRVQAGQTTTIPITLKPGAVIATAFVVHFRFDNSFVEPCMRRVLRQVMAHAESHADDKLIVVGHTDKTGSEDYNQSLSERRARSVFAFLTSGGDPAGALAEWTRLRQRATGGLPSIEDSWGTFQYQYMLQDLGFYPGNVDGDHGDQTDKAVESFRSVHGLPPGPTVNDAVWDALIRDYFQQDQDAMQLSKDQLLANASDGCDGGPLRWLGCGELSPLPEPKPPTEKAHRQYRRVELLFVRATELACKVPRPVTLDLPDTGEMATWCLGPGEASKPCCFASRECDSGGQGQFCITPAETGEFTVKGSFEFEDGTPAPNVKYVLIAPDGEFMDGEHATQPHKGEGNLGRAKDDSTFEYPGDDRKKAPGIFTVEVREKFMAHPKSDPTAIANGNVVCARLDGTKDLVVVLCTAGTAFDLQVTDTVPVGGAGSTTFLATRDTTGAVTITAVATASGTCLVPQGIEWTGGDTVPGNPLQRRVSRAIVGNTTVTATMRDTGDTRSVEIFVVRVTLDVDADRDGTVEEDAAGKDTWEFGAGKKGAVILVNNDDDDADGFVDADDDVVNGPDDVKELAPLVIRMSGPLPAGVDLVLSVSDQSKVRVFDARTPGATAVIGPPSLPAEFTVTTSTAADVEFGLEATQYPDLAFDGLIDLVLTLNEGATELGKDHVKVRAAPWIMSSHLEATERLFVIAISGFNVPPDSTFVDDIDAAAHAAGPPLTRASDPSFTLELDPWAQDCMELGYSRMPTQSFTVGLNAVNPRALEILAPDQLLGHDFGLELSLPNATFSTFDSHGNLEVSPPVTVGGKNFKLGRIYHGKGGRPGEPFSAAIKAFLSAQRVQKPFELDTNWLRVGHVDEVISFVPSNVGKPFRMLFASTTEALRILRKLKDDGHGDLLLFAGKPGPEFGERTINDLLKEPLLSDNADCQTKLDAIEATMVTELGLNAASDIVRIPSLFLEIGAHSRMFAALIPGMVNLLVITSPNFPAHQLVIPKPFGPTLGTVDQLEEDVRGKLLPLGYTVPRIRFVDDFDTYHIGEGEVHCATNSSRKPHTTPWWEQEDF